MSNEENTSAVEGKNTVTQESGKSQTNDSVSGKDTVDSNQNSLPDSIPYAKFQEKTRALRDAESKLEAFQKAQQEAEHNKKLEEGKFKELLEEQKPFVEKAKKLESILEKTVESMLEDIPEERRSLIPNLSVDEKFDYIHKNLKFLKGESKNVGYQVNPSNNTSTRTFTQQQLQDPKFYAENRTEILLASKEGRIKD